MWWEDGLTCGVEWGVRANGPFRTATKNEDVRFAIIFNHNVEVVLVSGYHCISWRAEKTAMAHRLTLRAREFACIWFKMQTLHLLITSLINVCLRLRMLWTATRNTDEYHSKQELTVVYYMIQEWREQ